MGKRIIIAGGGTGGHIFPAIAIANAIKAQAPDTEFLFVGAKGKMEMEKVPQAGYKIEGLDIAGFNRSSLIKNIGLPFKLVKSFFQVRRIFSRFNPDACIGVGGYSSFPVLRLAQAKGIKTFIHESNSFAGKSNILLGKKATQVFTAWDQMQQFFPAGRVVNLGNPVRQNILKVANLPSANALQFFALQPGITTVLVIGGSLGAQSINEAIAANLDLFAQNGWQLIWQTGKPFAEKAKAMAAGKANIWASDFITQMENAYAAADVVISRSGAMALSELCLVKKPVVFVPYPHAAEDHQTSNAKFLVDRNAALMVKDSEAGSSLLATVSDLCKDENKQASLKNNIAAFGVADADVKVAAAILKLI
jgi:UDP-N-acetylglucosamine--N-acetylmuramyl-(pentapeptide) pyrophosphoryl-undecaprenol N-acetylglucosamine transferase